MNLKENSNESDVTIIGGNILLNTNNIDNYIDKLSSLIKTEIDNTDSTECTNHNSGIHSDRDDSLFKSNQNKSNENNESIFDNENNESIIDNENINKVNENIF